MYNIGSVAAVFFTAPTNDYLGRRAGMFAGALIVVIGTCIQAPAISHEMFLGGRFVSYSLPLKITHGQYLVLLPYLNPH